MPSPAKISALYGHRYSAATEITVTAGATPSDLSRPFSRWCAPGDEVIVLEPCYDSYVPNIELAGGSVVRVPLVPGTFRSDFDKIAARALSPRTRAIIVNTPRNPSATVWTEAEMRRLEELLAPTEVFVIADEVYEHMVVRRRAPRERGPLPGHWRRAASSSAASARPTTSPAGRSATWPRRRR